MTARHAAEALLRGSATKGHPQPDSNGRMRCTVCGEFTARVVNGEYRHTRFCCSGSPT